jgi:hypothetical protein
MNVVGVLYFLQIELNNLFDLCKISVEKSLNNDQTNSEAKWIYSKKSIACFAINGILILLVITMTTLYITKQDRYLSAPTSNFL